jgi:hypothetical protein
MGKLVDNEQTKLSATYVNGLAIAIMAAGVVAPLVGVFTTDSALPSWQLALIFLCCMAISGGLHYVARLLLGELVE